MVDSESSASPTILSEPKSCKIRSIGLADAADVPAPTYVSAPKAIVSKRVIDLTTPGVWSDEQERLEREALAAASPSRDEIFDQQLADEAVERLKKSRASNE